MYCKQTAHFFHLLVISDFSQFTCCVVETLLHDRPRRKLAAIHSAAIIHNLYLIAKVDSSCYFRLTLLSSVRYALALKHAIASRRSTLLAYDNLATTMCHRFINCRYGGGLPCGRADPSSCAHNIVRFVAASALSRRNFAGVEVEALRRTGVCSVVIDEKVARPF